MENEFHQKISFYLLCYYLFENILISTSIRFDSKWDWSKANSMPCFIAMISLKDNSEFNIFY